MSQEARLETYVIEYTPDRTFVALVDKKPTLVPSLADAKLFHTATEAILVQHKFNLQTVSSIKFVNLTLEDLVPPQ